MKFFLQLSAVFIISILICSCKKSDPKTCWYLVDGIGNIINQVCNKTEAEMTAEYGSQYGFYKTSDPLYCWKLTRQSSPDIYEHNLPQYIVDKYSAGYVSEKVNCNSFCIWKILFKHKSKITGFYTPTTAKKETFLTALTDTCATLYVGRIVIVNETADSIHTAEFNEQY